MSQSGKGPTPDDTQQVRRWSAPWMRPGGVVIDERQAQDIDRIRDGFAALESLMRKVAPADVRLDRARRWLREAREAAEGAVAFRTKSPEDD